MTIRNQRCVSCGRFMRFEAGASWAQSWKYCMDGSPELNDPKWQCAPCTKKNGPLDTNCAYPERYSGTIKVHAEGAK